jgi:hypothetical protein
MTATRTEATPENIEDCFELDGDSGFQFPTDEEIATALSLPILLPNFICFLLSYDYNCHINRNYQIIRMILPEYRSSKNSITLQSSFLTYSV